jgi:hypothetical protein
MSSDIFTHDLASAACETGCRIETSLATGAAAKLLEENVLGEDGMIRFPTTWYNSPEEVAPVFCGSLPRAAGVDLNHPPDYSFDSEEKVKAIMATPASQKGVHPAGLLETRRMKLRWIGATCGCYYRFMGGEAARETFPCDVKEAYLPTPTV